MGKEGRLCVLFSGKSPGGEFFEAHERFRGVFHKDALVCGKVGPENQQSGCF